MHILRSFPKPTDVYISGDYYTDPKVKSAFGITDDESGIDITNGITKIGITTMGFVYVLTADEFREAIPSIDYLKEADDYDLNNWTWEGIFLKDFVGDIKLVLLSEEDHTERDIKKGDDVLRWNFDPTDYAWYQQSEKATLNESKPDGRGGFYRTTGSVVRTELQVILPPGTQMNGRCTTLELIETLKLRDNDNSKDTGTSD